MLNGTKQITIREGVRGYRKGSVLIGCHILGWATMREIISVDHMLLRDVSSQDMKEDGFDSFEHMLASLREYYPDLCETSKVTIVKWKQSYSSIS